MVDSVVQSHVKIVVGSDGKKPIRVLHVDDEIGLLKVAKQCLELQGPFHVDTATSVEEALNDLKEKEYDAVVSDYQMPGKDGLEFLEMLRKNGNTIPFIMFTGRGREEIAIKALNLGADQYLNKTGDPETVYFELEHALRRTVEQKEAERALEALGERYGRLFESAVEGILINGSDGRISLLNPAAANILGYNSPKELIGRPAVELYADPDSRARLLQELMGKGHVKERELTWKKKDGTLIDILASVTVQKDEKGNLLRTEGIIRDVSEKKRNEQLLREREEKYRSLVEHSTQGILIAQGPIPHMVFANSTMSKILGYTIEELTSLSPQQTAGLVHPDDRELFFGRFKDRLEGKHVPSHYEIRGIRKDGTAVWLELSSARIEYEGRPAVQAIFTDITERKKAEEDLIAMQKELRESEQKLRRVVCGSPIPAFFISNNHKVVYWNAALEKYSGLKAEEVLGTDQHWKPFYDKKRPCLADLVVDEAVEQIPKWYSGKYKKSELVEGGYEATDFFPAMGKKGKWLYFTAVAIRDSKGNVIGGVETLEDITERKEIENALRESQRKSEGLFRNNPEAAVYLDLDFKILNVNPRFCQLFGYSAREVKGKNINDVVAPENLREEAEGLDKDAKNGYASHNTVRKRKDGSLVPVSISASPVNFENKLLGYVGIYKDITDLKRAQEESEESKRHFQKCFDLMADPVAVVDGRGKILEVTQKVEEITGFKKEELVGRNMLNVEMFGVKTKAVMIKSLAKRMMGMHLEPYEVEVLRKDGGKLMYEINAAKIDYKGKPADLVVFRDILERKNLEEKLRVVGSLTRHDVRNKLSVVTGNAYLLKQKLAGNPEALEQLADMENAVRNVETIFEFARTYEKLGVEQLTYVDVKKIVDGAIGMFPGLQGVKIVNECRGLTVLADSLLRQLFYNLIDDSLKYGEKLTQIRVYYEEFEDKLKLIYEDDGVGISKDVKARLFTEGFTAGKGSGYGLYLIKRMMDVYGWAINEIGTCGKGAKFTISISKTKSDGRQNYKLS